MGDVTVKFSDLEFSFQFVSSAGPFECNAYLCKDTGHIYWESAYGDDDEDLPEDIDDGSKYIRIPHKNELDLGLPLVFEFVARNLPDDYDKVRAMFNRRGAYRRYKDLLERRGALQEWFKFEAAATDAALREWCAENNVKVDV